MQGTGRISRQLAPSPMAAIAAVLIAAALVAAVALVQYRSVGVGAPRGAHAPVVTTDQDAVEKALIDQRAGEKDLGDPRAAGTSATQPSAADVEQALIDQRAGEKEPLFGSDRSGPEPRGGFHHR